jgi:hypothetical protein
MTLFDHEVNSDYPVDNVKRNRSVDSMSNVSGLSNLSRLVNAKTIDHPQAVV